MLVPSLKEKRRQLFIESTKNGDYLRWVANAERCIAGYYWTIDTDDMAKDIVHKLTLKIIVGERLKEWDTQTPNINQVMFKDIKGEIYNLHKRESRKVNNDEENDKNNFSGNSLENLHSTTNEEVNMEYENMEVLEMLEKEIEEDDECLEIYLGVRTNDFDLKDDKQISKILNKDIKLIRAAKKRLKRYTDKLIVKIKKIKI